MLPVPPVCNALTVTALVAALLIVTLPVVDRAVSVAVPARLSAWVFPMPAPEVNETVGAVTRLLGAVPLIDPVPPAVTSRFPAVMVLIAMLPLLVVRVTRPLPAAMVLAVIAAVPAADTVTAPLLVVALTVPP